MSSTRLVGLIIIKIEKACEAYEFELDSFQKKFNSNSWMSSFRNFLESISYNLGIAQLTCTPRSDKTKNINRVKLQRIPTRIRTNLYISNSDPNLLELNGSAPSLTRVTYMGLEEESISATNWADMWTNRSNIIESRKPYDPNLKWWIIDTVHMYCIYEITYLRIEVNSRTDT